MKPAFVMMTFLRVVMLPLPAADWAVYGGNATHSGVSAETLSLPLEPKWIDSAASRPSPAWDETHTPPGQIPASTYDYAAQVTVVSGKVFFGSSSEDTVFCLDAATGRRRWSVVAEGAIRFAPTVVEDRVYFGSDDGCVYCVRADSGSLLWKFSAEPRPRRVIGSGKIMSQWPVRTSVEVADGKAYFGAGILPTCGTFVFAVDAATGKPLWKQDCPLTPEGTIVLTGDRMIVPAGLVAPLEFSRADGKRIPDGKLDYRRNSGGAFAGRLDEMVIYGASQLGIMTLRVSEKQPKWFADLLAKKDPRARLSDNDLNGSLTSMFAQRLIADDKTLYVLRHIYGNSGSGATRRAGPAHVLVATDKAAFIAAIQQSAGSEAAKALANRTTVTDEDPSITPLVTKAAKWATVLTADDVSMVLDGEHVFVGGKEGVKAFDAQTGKEVWQGKTEGQVWDLAIAGGRLFASTSLGHIYAFGRKGDGAAVAQPPSLPSKKPFLEDDAQRPWATRADQAIAAAGRKKGFCVVLGVGEGRLACELARRSEFTVVAVDPDAKRVAAAREKLAEAGLYGHRIVVHQVTGPVLPYASYFANLIVSESDGSIPYPAEEAYRLARPHGGVWIKDRQGTAMRRESALPGAGEWPHLYANPANTTSSDDVLVKGLDFDLQWIGPPGTRNVLDRHAEPMSPLYKDGRLFMLHRELLVAADAYNGVKLWEKTIKDVNRHYIVFDSGLMCLDDKAMYVAAGGKGLVLDPETGRTLQEIDVGEPKMDWGYMATSQNVLLGSAQNAEASMRGDNDRRDSKGIMFYQYQTYDGSKANANKGPNDANSTLSDAVFALDKSHDFRQLWRYKGVVLNTSFCVADDRLYFAESRNAQSQAHPTGRFNLRDFFASDVFLVALNLKTGEKIWETSLADSGTDHSFSLFYANHTLHYLNSRFAKDWEAIFSVKAFDPSNGSTKWTCDLPTGKKLPNRWAGNDSGHNQSWQAPVVVGGKAYINFTMNGQVGVVNLTTGKNETTRDFNGGRCTPFTASASSLFYRGGYTSTFDTIARKSGPVTRVTRPSCWISILPAGGLLMMPEGQSVGCACGYPLKTSIVMVPRQ